MVCDAEVNALYAELDHLARSHAFSSDWESRLVDPGTRGLARVETAPILSGSSDFLDEAHELAGLPQGGPDPF